MKKIIFKGLVCLSVLFFAVACSNDSQNAIDMNASASGSVKKGKQSEWAGVLGKVSNGEYVITADKESLLADFQEVVKTDGESVVLDDIKIIELPDDDNTGVEAFMMVASGPGYSIGTPIDKSGDLFQSPLGIYPSRGNGNVVSCKGCDAGCDLRYALIEGHKWYFCKVWKGCHYCVRMGWD